MEAKIIGTGSALPEKVVTNDEMSNFVDTSDEWISSRTGIRARRIAMSETVGSLAAQASQNAIAQAGISEKEIDLIIVATMSADHYLPNTACQVQELIGASNATCLDLNAACSGFVFALNTARAYIAANMYKTVLVAGAEVLSKLLDWRDRGTCVLFGDGAGAVLTQASEEPGIQNTVTGSDGTKGSVLTCSGRGISNPYVKAETSGPDYIQMDGKEVFKFAVRRVPDNITQLLAECQVAPEEVDHYILHQANARIISSVAKKLNISEDKFYINLDQYGNTSAATIPIALDEMVRSGRIARGDKCVISGFGGGLTWGSTLIRY